MECDVDLERRKRWGRWGAEVTGDRSAAGRRTIAAAVLKAAAQAVSNTRWSWCSPSLVYNATPLHPIHYSPSRHSSGCGLPPIPDTRHSIFHHNNWNVFLTDAAGAGGKNGVRSLPSVQRPSEKRWRLISV
ncbi:hypothetical protein E2C01_083543 [Portunus trituberculatus]|uniref:Uncharacterized protein n=1 Tax=Portunus trituberculatus TaxID=210409 RepID=A0A5B7J6V2_PORTR|nr:hypothetical protein [Portunus trituberculatus]